MDSSTQQAFTAGLRKLSEAPPDQVGHIFRQVISEAISEELPTVLENLGYSQEIAGLIYLLAVRSGDSREEVIRKALTLYEIALDEINKGNRVAILNPEDEIIREITGFQPAAAAPEALAK